MTIFLIHDVLAYADTKPKLDQIKINLKYKS